VMRALLILGAGLLAGCSATTIQVQGHYTHGPGTITVTIIK